MFKKFSVCSILFVIAFITGCSLDAGIGNVNSTKYGVTGSPFASVNELDSITNNTQDYVYWRYARTFALMEFIRFKNDHNWQGSKLSERPIIVYGNNLLPKYYEFRIISGDGLEIGAISCVARKREGGPVVYVLPKPSDYSEVPESTKSSIYHIIANDYPRTVVAGFLFSRGGVTKGIGLKGEDVTIEKDPFDYAMAHPEIYTNSNITLAMAKEYVDSLVTSNKNMWEKTESIESNLYMASTNDEGFESMLEEANSKASSFDGGYVINGFTGYEGANWWDYRYLKTDLLNWTDSKYIKDYSGPWCGPSAAAMVLAFYGYTSKTRYNSESDDGYYNICTNMGISDFNNGGTLGWDVCRAINWGSAGAINYSYYLTIFDFFVLFQLLGIDSWGQATRSVNNNNPFVINRLGWIDGRDGGFLGIGTGHYRIGVGYKDNSYWSSYFNVSWVNVFWFIWVPIVTWYVTYTDARYYLLLDGNGAEASSSYVNNPGGRDYLNNKNGGYCDNLFWEKKGTGDYMVLEFLYKQ